MVIVTPIPNVDPALQLAFNAAPDSVLLIGLMADNARENGDTETADALSWLWSRQLVPVSYGYWSGWYWADYKCDKHTLPNSMPTPQIQKR